MLSLNSASNISFTSRSVGTVKILRKNSPYYANLVNFDLNADLPKIRELCDTKDFISFGRQLYKDLIREPEFPVNKKYCFALVKNSEKDFSNVDNGNVLGIYTVYESCSKGQPVKIAYFMTKHDYQHCPDSNREFSGIGRGMFNSIRAVFPDKSLSGYAASKAVEFWKKMGFETIAGQTMMYEI